MPTTEHDLSFMHIVVKTKVKETMRRNVWSMNSMNKINYLTNWLMASVYEYNLFNIIASVCIHNFSCMCVSSFYRKTCIIKFYSSVIHWNSIKNKRSG